MSPCSQYMFTLVTAAGWLGMVQSGRFLAPFVVSPQQLEKKMMAELSGHFQSAENEIHLAITEQDLSPMFAALPKNEYGNLNHVVARYALHRHFAHRYSWNIRGLSSDGEFNVTTGVFRALQSDREFSAANASAPLPISIGTVPTLPEILQRFMDHLHNGQGLNLQGLAVVAAALDETARLDQINRLGLTYKLFRCSKESHLNGKDATKLLDAFMVLYNNATNVYDWTEGELRYVVTNDTQVHDTDVWEKVHPFMQEVRARTDIGNNVNSSQSLDFKQASKIVIAYGHSYGAFYSTDCYSMKHGLIGMEGRKAGRVRLSDFYNSSRYSDWVFTEHIDYLRMLGVLDESNASNPQVIVPNYVTSQPNCLVASGLYDICCPNECDPLMRALERDIGGPQDDPEGIVRIVSELATDTSPASPEEPRQLSEAVLQRLHDIADQHGGKVPIHGRLFAQWMHHAFPRECPYPHVDAVSSGGAKLDEWLLGHGTKASGEQMDQQIRPDDTCPQSGDGDGCSEDLPWTHAEMLMGAGPSIVLESRQVFHSIETSGSMVVYEFTFMALVAILVYLSIASRVIFKTKCATAVTS